MHRANGPGRGKPVLFTCSLGFHAITLERSSFINKALNPLVSLFYLFVARSGGNRQTDRHTYTVTLAAHARRGKIRPYCVGVNIDR